MISAVGSLTACVIVQQLDRVKFSLHGAWHIRVFLQLVGSPKKHSSNLAGRLFREFPGKIAISETDIFMKNILTGLRVSSH